MDKRKKSIRLLWGTVLIISLAVFLIVVFLVNSRDFMGMRIVGAGEWERSTASKPIIQTNEMDRWIQFNGNQIPYDSESNTLYISQNADESFWEGKFTTVDKNSRLIIVSQDSLFQKAEAIKESQLFHIYLEKGDYCLEGNLIFTGLPVLCVETDCTWLYNPYDSEVHNYSIKKTQSTYRITDSGKYTLKLWHEDTGESNRVSYLDLGKNSEWKLLPMARDNSALRSSVAIEFWNQIGGREEDDYNFKVKADYAEVLIDRQYCGLYLMMWPQEPKEFGLKEGDYLYNCKASLKNSNIEALIAQEKIEIEGRHDEITDSDWKPLYIGNPEIDNYIDFFLFQQLVYNAEGLNRKKLLFAQQINGGEDYRHYRIPNTFIDTFGLLSTNYPYYTEDLDGEVFSRVLEDWELEELTFDETLLTDRWQQLKSEGMTVENAVGFAENKREYLIKSGVFIRNSAIYNERFSREVIEFIKDRFKMMDELYG